MNYATTGPGLAKDDVELLEGAEGELERLLVALAPIENYLGSCSVPWYVCACVS